MSKPKFSPVIFSETAAPQDGTMVVTLSHNVYGREFVSLSDGLPPIPVDDRLLIILPQASVQ